MHKIQCYADIAASAFCQCKTDGHKCDQLITFICGSHNVARILPFKHDHMQWKNYKYKITMNGIQKQWFVSLTNV